MDLVDKIKELTLEHLSHPSHFLVDVLISKYKPTKIVVQLDGDKGINIDDCAMVSRKLSAQLEELNLIEGAYTLEVGTPGLDVPLKMTRQYHANIGRNVRVHLNSKKYVDGLLKDVNDTRIVLETVSKATKKKCLTELFFSDIIKTNIIVSFN